MRTNDRSAAVVAASLMRRGEQLDVAHNHLGTRQSFEADWHKLLCHFLRKVFSLCSGVCMCMRWHRHAERSQVSRSIASKRLPMSTLFMQTICCHEMCGHLCQTWFDKSNVVSRSVAGDRMILRLSVPLMPTGSLHPRSPSSTIDPAWHTVMQQPLQKQHRRERRSHDHRRAC